jgi:hypothetical protein
MNQKYGECLMTLKNSKKDEIPSYPIEVIDEAY